MLQLLSILYFFTKIFFASSTSNTEVINTETIDNDVAEHSHNAADGDYPYIVSLALIDEQVVTRHCTGSLIRPKWVLSSAYCFYGLLDNKFYVWYQNFTVSPLESKFYSEVIKIYIHPEFINTKFTAPGFFFGDNDISVLKVGRVIIPSYGRLSNIHHSKMNGLAVKYIGDAVRYLGGAEKIKQSICNITMNIKKILRGYVKTKEQEEEMFKPLQVGEGIVVTCGMALTMWSKYVLCVTPKCSDRLHHPLHGDTGGPFIYDGKIVGVMSSSFLIPNTFLTSNGLTPVSPYIDWINQVTKSGKIKEKHLIIQENIETYNTI